MLVRWATEEERKKYDFDGNEYHEFEVVVASDRMTNEVLGILGFSRELKEIKKTFLFNEEKKEKVINKLMRVAMNQIFPKGGSFHYQYSKYDRNSKKEFCPVCKNLPMPEGMEDIAELEYSFVSVEEKAQGCLFGKCVVIPKYHSIYFYDIPDDIMMGFMKDVKKVASALKVVTQAVKINFEIHANSGPHTHCHLFPRYLDDDFPSSPIDYRMTEPSPYESKEEYRWFIDEMKKRLNEKK